MQFRSGRGTITKLFQNWDLISTTFAQTPAPGFAPQAGQTYYDGTHPASSRVRANYTYDGAGRTTDLTYYQENWNGSSYTSTALYENSAAYDPSLGLKTSSMNAWQGGTSWTETYGYDPNFDYLTSVNYGDGNPNPIQSWIYDAAGNRTHLGRYLISRACQFNCR